MTRLRTHDDTGLDQLDPAIHDARDARHFRRIVAAKRAVEESQAELRAAVAAAREAGDSWTAIGAALETSKQNAYQRFGKGVNTMGKNPGVETYHEGDQWKNRVQGNERASSTHATKKEAQAAGREMAIKRETEHTIKNMDGRIGGKNSYGNDPRKSKG
jgi:hypothetical protein